jgi:membrane protein implicated in regulation of membrane protease activity
MSLTFWHWFVLGGLLLLLEVITPGFVFIWLALAAALTGVLLWLLPQLGWQLQVLWFAAAAVASVGAWFWWWRRAPRPDAGPELNQRVLSFVGSEAVLATGIGPGHGRVRIADSTWPASGPELPAGTRVRVVGARGTVLLVVAAEPRDKPGSPAAA